MDYEKYMRMALEEARAARSEGEVPIGCVIADEKGEVIARAHNRGAHLNDPLRHAETEAISRACRLRGGERLSGCTLFVTAEPCPMCAGAIILSRVKTLVYGAREELTGSCASVLNLFEERYPSRPAIYSGVLKDECAEIMSDFFAEVRRRKDEG